MVIFGSLIAVHLFKLHIQDYLQFRIAARDTEEDDD